MQPFDMQSDADVNPGQFALTGGRPSSPAVPSSAVSSSSSSVVPSTPEPSSGVLLSSSPSSGLSVVRDDHLSTVAVTVVITWPQFQAASSLPSLQSACRSTPFAMPSQRKISRMHSCWSSHIHMLLPGHFAAAFVVAAIAIVVVVMIAGLHVSSDSSLPSLQSGNSKPSHFHAKGMHWSPEAHRQLSLPHTESVVVTFDSAVTVNGSGDDEVANAVDGDGVLAKNSEHAVAFSSLLSAQSAGSVPSHQNRLSIHSIPFAHSHSSAEQSVVVVVVCVADVVVVVVVVIVAV